ncbi:squalene/phytoene synthase family protein [uncultured Maricaulis sp.]|uniref:squalene/phytoene synthase family protein n=1 Tax=uncultured Maricaulis sp. TaxID=174710 RepID=UPI0025CC790C|nr:squalene/phytoene synthase family protein [uncultured Maricaulis sp.]
MTAKEIDSLLQTADPDRYLCALFAQTDQRAGLLALYGLNHELGRIADSSSESLIGEMKLTWWRDAIADLYATPQKVRRHDVTEGLAALTGQIGLADVSPMIEARFDDIAARPFTDLGDILAYVDNTAVCLARLALKSLDAADSVSDDTVLAAGRAWGLTGLLRAFPLRARIGRAPVGGDALGAVGATPAMLAQGLGEAKVAEARQGVIEAARAACERLAMAGPIPPEAVPAIGYCRLASTHLARLPANPYGLAPDINPLSRRLRLTWLALSGR